MKAIINGKTYNTETAKFISRDKFSEATPKNDLEYFKECLYQKKTGEYFLYGEGGPNSKYSKNTKENEWSYGRKILPLTEKEANDWIIEFAKQSD